ncbi:MAG: ParA family protein [Phycisphaerae bacterium]|nr:ParA family protein [Phycisphaerae bacterium]
MQTIAVLNPKGGTGKTTCAVNLAAALLTLSKKVLLIDLDPQAQLTRSLGLAADRNVRTVGDLLNTAASPVECIIHRDGLCVIPARPDLAAVEIALAGQKRNAANALASALGNGRLSYDFTLIDTPPSLGLLTVNALAAADRVLVPVNMEPMALPGVERALAAVEEYGQSANAALAVAGIIGNRLSRKRRLNGVVAQRLKDAYGELVLEPIIHDNVAVAEAPEHGRTVFEHAPDSPGAADFLALAALIASS